MTAGPYEDAAKELDDKASALDTIANEWWTKAEHLKKELNQAIDKANTCEDIAGQHREAAALLRSQQA